jgi:peroxiredoxin Q/BCP
MLKPGNIAPEFTLLSHKNETITLSTLRGKKVVLYFYPKDDTSGCTKEACGFRDNLPKIETQKAIILGVSPDSVESHQKFIKKYDLNFTLLSDTEHQVAEAYGVWGEKQMYGKNYWGILRTTFIINEKGVIEHVFEKVKVDGHAEEVLVKL